MIKNGVDVKVDQDDRPNNLCCSVNGMLSNTAQHFGYNYEFVNSFSFSKTNR